MEITFDNRRYQELSEQQTLAQKEFGKVGAHRLRSRLADLAAAKSVRDLVAGRPHPLKGDRTGQFALDLEGAKRLVFRPANDPVPCREDKSIDWSKVTSICVVFIGDYHD